MKSFDENWSRTDAVQKLFFCDLTGDLGEIGNARMRELINQAFYDVELRSTALHPVQQDVLWRATRAVKAAFPNLTPASTFHAVLWLRWVLHSTTLPIANRFWLNFTGWRSRNEPAVLRLMQYQNTGMKTWRGKARTVQGVGKVVGYTIDQMFVRKDFAFNEYEVKWRLKSFQLDVVRAQQNVRRDVQAICGRNMTDLLRECVHLEAESKTSKLLSGSLINGKYICSMPPAELLEELKSHYSALKRYSDETLKRGLSAFVQCPRGRPGGLRPSR
jgi:hypothetical protein